MTDTPLDLATALSRWSAAWNSDDGPAAALDLLRAAEHALAAPAPAPAATWHEYLDATRRPSFLRALDDAEARERWAETAFRAIRVSDYSLRTMLGQRAAAHPDRILFQDRREEGASSWSYAQVARYARAIAGVFLAESAEPRVVIFCENNVDGAVADLACLTEGILVAPLNVHTDEDTLAWILERLDIGIVLTDSDARQERVEDACRRAGRQVALFRTGGRGAAGSGSGSAGSTAAAGAARGRSGATVLREACARVDLDEVARRLAGRRPDITAPATVMFTSGSTGQARGVVFSQYMLVSKRFARAAALPDVGEDEVLLCYLPLFHTFGRYLEMLGMLFWGGTYVFAGNPSAEALIAEMGRVRPTGLISVPVRWTQIREHCLEAMGGGAEGADATAVVREAVGDRLRWGLSAAGYLDPRVFRFFHRHQVELCSGFGMTEATGGITMTPPGAYVEDTVGVPLPGMRTELDADGELRIAGEYVAHYLDGDGPPGSLPGLDPDAEHWIRTGDLFRRRPDGYYQIVDRIKDIYKNSRGQTVAPQRVERLFVDVPGVRRAFLVGDHRDHNVLLIVPDADDALLARHEPTEAHEYFARIVAAANAGLAPYERVVRFALLDRDFDVDRGELTPKGTFRRKAIEENFSAVIEELYRSKHVELAVEDLRIRIPRWFFRDLGVLEDDIVAGTDSVENLRTGRSLAIAPGANGRIRVGDLEYRLDQPVVDLGLFARQPRLWLGNPSLAAFSPCKAGWDISLRGASDQVRLPHPGERPGGGPGQRTGDGSWEEAFDEGGARLEPERLALIHRLAATALLAPATEARAAIEALGRELPDTDARLGPAVRRRIEALAFRAEEPIRALAYRTLLLDVPVIDYDRVFPAFLESGLSFLDETTIEAIASASGGERRLQSLRQRLYSYRTNLEWPGPPVRRRQLRRVFRMLAQHARHHPHDLAAVQAELAAWALFDQDPELARAAQRRFDALMRWHEERLMGDPHDQPTDGKVVFELGIARDQRARLEDALFHPTFIRRSISHAFGDDDFGWDLVGPEGVWVSPMLSHRRIFLYRVGINLVDGRHFDMILATGDLLRSLDIKDTILWLTTLSDHAFGAPALPPFGAWRKDLGVMSLAYVSHLNAWERIREISSRHDAHPGASLAGSLHKLYVRAMATFFRAWEQSGYRIVPGEVSPSNVALPDADFQETSSILSLAGWRAYTGPLSLVRPMVRTFYRLTAAHYPKLRDALRLEWLFDACLEGLDGNAAHRFLRHLEHDLRQDDDPGSAELLQALLRYHEDLDAHEHLPLPVLCAIDRYRQWARLDPDATAEAREESVQHMVELYRLERFPDAFRYHLYRHTYFADADLDPHADADADLDAAFARLIRRGLQDREGLTGHLEELSNLQSLLRDPVDRAVFSRMVFPHARRAQKLELLAVGETDQKRVIVRSRIEDDAGTPYVVREPLNPGEVGHLYRLILQAGYRMHVSEDARQLVIADPEERIVGGLSYRWEDGRAAAIDAVVVARSLTNRGLGGRLLEDFCVRVAAQGAQVAKTNFFLAGLFTKHGFHVSQRWGGLVRTLEAYHQRSHTLDHPADSRAEAPV
jgi:long-chain acyl-CoA synthetase